jgi:hypothetical protein
VLLAFIVLTAADGGTPDAGHPPPGLACLAKYYVGTVKKTDAGWGLELPDASFLSWEGALPVSPMPDDPDGGEISDGGEEDDDTPDVPALKDIFATPYEKGAIKPVEGDDTLEDPGRARIDPLFRAAYGDSWRSVMSHLGKVKFFGLRYPFHERAAEALERVTKRLQAEVDKDPKLLPFMKNIGGTWHWRRIARSRAISTHAFGIAIDLNVERSNYWRWQRPKKPLKWKNRYPQVIVDAFEAEGFIWGGRWVHYDTMHFEYRPELLDPTCH